MIVKRVQSVLRPLPSTRRYNRTGGTNNRSSHSGVSSSGVSLNHSSRNGVNLNNPNNNRGTNNRSSHSGDRGSPHHHSSRFLRREVEKAAVTRPVSARIT